MSWNDLNDDERFLRKNNQLVLEQEMLEYGRNKYWKELRKKEKFEPYSIRHGYAVCGHKYNIAPSILAGAMGHDVDVHNRSYSKWYGDDYFDDIFEKATQS